MLTIVVNSTENTDVRNTLTSAKRNVCLYVVVK